MRSATDFLPWLISTLTNFATSLFEYFGSGRISRFEISLRRGINHSVRAKVKTYFRPVYVHRRIPGRAGEFAAKILRKTLGSLRLLGAVLRAALLAVLDSGGIERAAHHVVTHTRQILDAATADQDHRVLLQVVALAADVADDFESVGQPHLRNLAQRRVRLLWRRRVHASTDTALLWAALQRGHLALRHRGHTALAH